MYICLIPVHCKQDVATEKDLGYDKPRNRSARTTSGAALLCGALFKDLDHCEQICTPVLELENP